MIIVSENVVLQAPAAGVTFSNDNPVIGYHNVLDSGTVTADNEETEHPARNLANESTALKWVGADPASVSPALTEQFITLTNAAFLEDLDYVAIAGHNFGSGGFGIKVERQGDDASLSNHALTFSGDAQIDASEKQFGDGSLLLDGVGDNVLIPHSADWTFDDEFTVECWIRPDQTTGTHSIVSQWLSPSQKSWLLRWHGTGTAFNDNSAQFIYSLDGSVQFNLNGDAGDVLPNVWTHIAVTRDSSGNIRLFVNGVQSGSTIVQASAFHDSTHQLQIGVLGGDLFSGNIDQLEIIKGRAAYTGTFTAPVKPAAVSAEHVLYLSFDTLGWSQLIAEQILPDDEPVLFRFLAQNLDQVRIRLAGGSGKPEAAVIYLGALLVLERRIYVGHTPINYGRSSKVVQGRSDSGQYLGTIVISESVETSVSLENLTPSWYRDSMEPFIKVSRDTPFFFAWRPSSYPFETGFTWAADDPKVANQRNNGMMSVSMKLSGISRL